MVKFVADGARPLRVAMLGGTFDPVHVGHLRSAVELHEALGLDGVHMVPAARSPLRESPDVSSADRFALLQRGIGDTPGLMADDRELSREGPSYSVDTLADLRRDYGDQARLIMVLGVDAFMRLPEWRDPQRLFDLAHLVVIERPGYTDPMPDALRDLLSGREARGVSHMMDVPQGRWWRLSLPTRLAISATEVRKRLSSGQSVRYLLPEAVEAHIRAQGLYRTVE